MNRLDVTSGLLPTAQIDLIVTSGHGVDRHFKIVDLHLVRRSRSHRRPPRYQGPSVRRMPKKQ